MARLRELAKYVRIIEYRNSVQAQFKGEEASKLDKRSDQELQSDTFF